VRRSSWDGAACPPWRSGSTRALLVPFNRGRWRQSGPRHPTVSVVFSCQFSTHSPLFLLLFSTTVPGWRPNSSSSLEEWPLQRQTDRAAWALTQCVVLASREDNLNCYWGCPTERTVNWQKSQTLHLSRADITHLEKSSVARRIYSGHVLGLHTETKINVSLLLFFFPGFQKYYRQVHTFTDDNQI